MLATRSFEASIPVGTHPSSLDLSPDEDTLYVTNRLSGDVSIIDLATRRELRRLPLGDGARPESVAVAATGLALVSARDGLGNGVPAMVSIDPATHTVTARPDWPHGPAVVEASGDRSQIGVLVGTPVGNPSLGYAAFYESAADRFSPARLLSASGPVLALDRTGSTMLAGADTLVFHRDLVTRATIPGPEIDGLAMDPNGTTGYRLNGARVEVVDVARAVVTHSITLPDPVWRYQAAMDLTSDDATIVAVSQRGLSVVPVAAAMAVSCPLPAAPAGVVPVCGAPLTDVVVDGRGRAYASNPSGNQIEVVSLATRQLEAPIPVGSQPRTMDLAPDGKTLYVVNTGAEDISVVDLGLRREVRRITVASREHIERPRSFAVASNGTGLLTTRPLFHWNQARLLQVDLVTGAVEERTDYPGGPPHPPTARPGQIEASGNGAVIALLAGGGPSEIFLYSAASDSFGPARPVASPLRWAALDATGSKITAGPGTGPWDAGTFVLDRGLVLRATVPSYGVDVAVDATGTTAYGFGGRIVDVIDLSRGVVSGRITLPESAGPSPSGAVALSPDGATVAALTNSGFSIAAVSTGVPEACPAPTAPASVVPICGAPLGEMVVDPSGPVFVSNPNRNQVEVVSMATGAVEPAIPVGSRPRGLDLSSDGATLYVANSGADEISVVDVAQRREVRRITVPDLSYDHPFSIAVGDHGRALFTTSPVGPSSGSVYELDLADETIRHRDDFGEHFGSTGDNTVLKASGDRSHIAVADRGTSSGPVWRYTTATDSFSGPVRLERAVSSVALDRTGSRMLVAPEGFVLDDQLRVEGTIPSGGKGVAVSASGTTGYRTQESKLEVLDLDRRTVVRSDPLPEAVGPSSGAVALSPDETQFAALTARGVALLPPVELPPPPPPTPPPTQQTPLSVWVAPTATPLDGMGAWTAIVNEPAPAPGQTPPSYFYGHSLTFGGSPAQGMVGLSTGSTGKLAMFSLVAPNGAPQSATIPFDWKAGGFYYTFVYRTGPASWGAWVLDHATGGWTMIGQLQGAVAWGGLSIVSVSMALWHGPQAAVCSAYPRAEVVISPPVAYVGLSATVATLAGSYQTEGDCPSSVTAGPAGWPWYRLGSDGP